MTTLSCLTLTLTTEQPQENPEHTLKEFMQSALKLPHDTVNNITFHRVHRIGTKNNSNRPRPIIAKFEHYEQKELIKNRGKELKGIDYGLNDQFPCEIQERRRKMLPVLKQNCQQQRKVILTVDKLYIDGKLFRDPNITAWF